MAVRKDLGALLLDEGIVRDEDLERLAEKSARRPMWARLVEAGLASGDQIFAAMSRFGVPIISDEKLATVEVPPPLFPYAHRVLAREAGILPIDLSADGTRATVAMIDPSDERTLAEFLTLARVPEGRAVLCRRDSLFRAAERLFGETTDIVSPLPPPRLRRATPPSTQSTPASPPMAPVAASTPPPPLSPMAATPPVASEPTTQAIESASEALRQEERLTRALVQTVEALAGELEARLCDGGQLGRKGAELARLARRVARQLGLSRRASDEIGVAAQLFVLDRLLRKSGGVSSADLFADFGWVAAGEGGLVPMLRSLTAASSGFRRAQPGSLPIGTRILAVVADYEELGANAATDLGTVSQVLRASTANAQVVDALLRVLESDRARAVPATVVAESLFQRAEPSSDEEAPTPKPTSPTPPRDEKTERRPYPRKRSKGE